MGLGRIGTNRFGSDAFWIVFTCCVCVLQMLLPNFARKDEVVCRDYPQILVLAPSPSLYDRAVPVRGALMLPQLEVQLPLQLD